MKKNYAAYGSNLNLKQMKTRIRSINIVGTDFLKGYRLAFKGGYSNFAYLTIEKCKEKEVPLGIFKIGNSAEYKLDRYEGYPHMYQKRYIDIHCHNETEEALIYVMRRNLVDYHLPSKFYFDTCLKGYLDFGFDPEILYEALDYTVSKILVKTPFLEPLSAKDIMKD